MLSIYKNKKDIPSEKEYVELNDLYFNMNTASLLDDRAKEIIETIDGSELISRYKIRSRFNGDVLNVDKLSSGCKTVLNVLYNPEKVFCLKECGENALDVLFGFEEGTVYSDSPKGASASAMLYSLVVSAKMNGLNAEDYLIRLFRSPDPVLPYETT